LANAKTVLMRFRIVGNLPLPMPEGPLALDLDRTREALSRYRAAGPQPVPARSSLIEELTESMDYLLRRLAPSGTDQQPAPPKL
jgi:hypothetical protein